MGVLKHPKHERFAQFLAEGKAQTAAYVAAGYKAHSGNACVLAGRPHIIERVAELQQRVIDIRERATARAVEAAVETTLKGTDVIGELAKIGFSNILNYMTIGPDGVPDMDWSNLTRDQAAAIDHVIIETRTLKDEVLSRKVRFKLLPKIPALDLLGKYFALWREKIELSKTPIGPATAAEMWAELVKEAEELGLPLPSREKAESGIANRPLKDDGGTTH